MSGREGEPDPETKEEILEASRFTRARDPVGTGARSAELPHAPECVDALHVELEARAEEPSRSVETGPGALERMEQDRG